MKTISASDQNFNLLFLTNEFSKIFEGLFITEMTHVDRRTKNNNLRPEVDVGNILEIVGCKMFSRKLL